MGPHQYIHNILAYSAKYRDSQYQMPWQSQVEYKNEPRHLTMLPTRELTANSVDISFWKPN